MATHSLHGVLFFPYGSGAPPVNELLVLWNDNSLMLHLLAAAELARTISSEFGPHFRGSFRKLASKFSTVAKSKSCDNVSRMPIDVT